MPKNIRAFVCPFILVLAAVFLSSCATPPAILKKPLIIPLGETGLTHTLARGETLWRLSQTYGVSVEDLMRANDLRGTTDLEVGRKIFIPGVDRDASKKIFKRSYSCAPRGAIPLYPSKRWKYIIIHHSATDDGNAFFFNLAHLRRGFKKGLGYHFVIDNGTKGKADGEIEVARRWKAQDIGAHCNAARMNYKAIGICLVGNFSKDKVSENQMEALAYLVKKLQAYYNIPDTNVLRHGRVVGAKTECPGRKFPWPEFLKRIKETAR